jgi:N-acyl-D-aspartate/D-glutamate deacylase
MLVTPGFIDVHTHFDAQVTWDDRLEPAVWHGVTTVIIGNCGVGFAPVRPNALARATLIGMMESVENIPPESMHAAMPWNWESYPDYLQAVDAKRRTIDVGSMITYCTLRIFVMGDRATETPTEAEIATMAELVREGMRAGAVGLSMSRTILHTTGDGVVLPGTFADEDELVALAKAVMEGGGGKRGILEVSPASTAFPEPVTLIDDVDMLIRVARRSRCPVVFSLLQAHHAPREFATVLEHVSEANKEGLHIYPEVAVRPVSVLMSWQGGFHPFATLPSFAAVRKLPFVEMVAKLRDPALRARLIVEENPKPSGLDLVFVHKDFWSQVFVLGTPINYYPELPDSLESHATKRGVSPRELAYDAMMSDDGNGLLTYAVTNWAARDRQDLHDMVTHPASLLGLGDGGAHLTSVVDVSQPTTLLAEWVRERGADHPHGLSIETAIKKLTLDNATAFGLTDRGRITVGKKADINVIDLERLRAERPVLVEDLPLGKPRFDQRARGYVATIVAGEVIQRDGVLTDARPGRLAVGLDS